MNIDRYKQTNLCSFRLLYLVLMSMLVCIYLRASGIIYTDSTKRNNWTLLALYQQGSVFQSNAFLRGKNINHKPIRSFRSFSLEFLWQTTGKKLWEQLYNYPHRAPTSESD